MRVTTTTRVTDDVRMTAQGLVAQTCDREALVNGQVLITGTIYFVGIGLIAGQTITNLSFGLTGNAVTTTVNKMGLYDKLGNRKGITADYSGSVTSGSPKVVTQALLSTFVVTSTDLYYAALICVASGTVLSALRGASNLAATAAIGSGPLLAGTQTAQADLVDPATITAGTPFGLWIGAS